ncbi:MAG: hypothetical protein ACFE0P_14775 [Oceanicaulis sp.]
MAVSPPRSPTRRDLALSRVLNTVMIVFALALLPAAALVDDASAAGFYVDVFAAALAFGWAGAMIVLKLRGDFILGLFGYWWPFVLPKSDEMARSIRQEAFGFAYLVLISALLVIFCTVIPAAALFAGVEVRLQGLLATLTLMDALLCVLAILILLAVLPQAYLAWTLTPLEDDDTEAGA